MWILFCFAIIMVLAPAAQASDASILVLLQSHAHRDADLRQASLSQTQIEKLERISGSELRQAGIERDGAHRLQLAGPSAQRPAIDMVLKRLREHPDIIYADRKPMSLANDPTTGGSQSLDRLVILFRDSDLRDLSDQGGEFPVEKKRQLIRLAGVPMYIERPMSGGAWVLRLFQRMPVQSVQAIAHRIAADESVSWVVPAVRGRFQAAPNDPLFAQQWSLHDPVAGIHALEAWEWTTGSPEVVVAVLDSGIRSNHPDLISRVLPGFDFVSDVWRAEDYNGRDDSPMDPGDASRDDECAAGSTAAPSSWHGTHVAGTIGAVANNGMGIAGIDWSAQILPVRVGAKCGIDPVDLADAIQWSAGTLPARQGIPPNRHPADIINLSVGFPGSCPPYVQGAINSALAAGSLVVAAAGNHSSSAEQYYPANCSGVLSVSATDRWGGRTGYSNYGRAHLAAPGGNPGSAGGIVSTVNAGMTRPMEETYGDKVGTSMAAPHVSAVASLVLARNPQLRPGELFNILIETARAFPPDAPVPCNRSGPLSCGAGIVDAGSAVQSAGR